MKENQKIPLARSPEKNSEESIRKVSNLSHNFQQVIHSPWQAQESDFPPLQQIAGNTAVSGLFSSHQVQREPTTDESGFLSSKINRAIQLARGTGSPLPQSLREKMEEQYRTDFSAVRLHTDSQADQLSQQLNARAFTIGSDIFFKNGVYAPGTSQGNQTLHHELTHVQQQGRASDGALKLGSVHTPQEREADRMAHQVKNVIGETSGAMGTVQREMDYVAIAARIGNGVTAEMVKTWVQNVKAEDEDSVQTALMAGRGMLPHQKAYLKMHGIDVNKMEQDINRVSGPAPVIGSSQLKQSEVPPPPLKRSGASHSLTQTTSNAPQSVQEQPPVPTAQQSSNVNQSSTASLQTDPEEKIRQYILTKSLKANMPSGPLVDILKDVGKGSLSGLSEAQVDEVIDALSKRDFDALAKKGVSISKIVEFTSRFERHGVGETNTSNDRSAITKALLGGEGGKGGVQNTADFLQNSLLLSLGFGGIGGILGQSGMMETIFNRDIGEQDQANMNLASGLFANTGLALTSFGQLMQSGIDFSESANRGKNFHKSLRGAAQAQSGVSGSMNLIQSTLGFAGAGLGFGQTGVQFGTDTANAQAGLEKSVDPTADALGLGKSILGTTQSAISTVTSGGKATIAKMYVSNIKKVPYSETPYLTPTGKSKEKAVFPKLKSLLVEAAEKKGQAEGWNVASGAVGLTGGITRSLGYLAGAGSTARTITGAIGTVGSLAVPIIKGITGLIKGKAREKKIEQAGFRNEKEYRLQRMRELQSYDEQGNAGKEKFSVSVSEVLNQTAEVYEDYENWARGVGNQSDSKKADERASLSVSKLLSNSGEYGLANTVITTKEPATRREAIKSIILARQATY